MEIEFRNAKRVVVKGLYQVGTYDGLLEGVPTEKMNRRILAGVIERAKQLFHVQEVYLIEAKQTPIDIGRPLWFGSKPAALPKMLCIAELWHHEPAKSRVMDFSSLSVVWFQQDFALPIDTQVLEQFKTLAWDELAGDGTY